MKMTKPALPPPPQKPRPDVNLGPVGCSEAGLDQEGGRWGNPECNRNGLHLSSIRSALPRRSQPCDPDRGPA